MAVESVEIEDDLVLLAATTAALQDALHSAASAISVSVNAGWITLAGPVRYMAQKCAAEAAACALPGIRGITNHIEVHCPGKRPLRFG